MLTIRIERPEDHNRVRAINDLAFGRTQEGAFVRTLLENPGDGWHLSFVAEDDSGVVGHLLLSHVTVGEGAEAHDAVLFGPHSVLPGCQRQGIGAALIRRAMDYAEEQGERIFLAVGAADYYTRFGFEPASRYGIHPPEASPDGTFLVRFADRAGCAAVRGAANYPPMLRREQ